jgi:RND family efflux transporter MFP subunit
MKTVTKILVLVVFVSCGAPNTEMVRKQIEAKRSQVEELQKEIAELEKQVSDSVENGTTTKIAVAIKEVKPELFKHYITVFGNVEADQYAKISPEMNGQIRTIHVNEGQRVNKGELMVSLNTDASRSSLNEARTSSQLAKTTFEKQESLWREGIGSEIQYLQAKSQKESAEARVNMLEAQLEMAQIRAPFNGIVDKIYMKEGELAGPSMPVLEFVNLSRLTIRADVSESYISDIRAGEKVNITFSSLPDVEMDAVISRTTKVINSGNRTFQVELKIANPGEKIRPNMISSIRINDFTAESAFVVPSIVIKRDITGDYLYVATRDKDQKPVATKKYITRGISYEGETMIEKGLKEGDKVITDGYNLVSTGTFLALN